MSKQIPIVENILSANDKLALDNQSKLDANGVLGLNVMASPGAGKTSVIEQTIKGLQNQYKLAVIEGDTAAPDIDSARAEKAGAVAAVQINTGGNCHLEANMMDQAISQLDLNAIDLLIVENVGNLICPSGWKLGTHKNVLIASIPEGDDKPYKYPAIYRGIDVLVINKVDLLPYIDFDMDYFKRGVEILSPGLTTFPVSCRTGEGIDEWLGWIKTSISNFRASVE